MSLLNKMTCFLMIVVASHSFAGIASDYEQKIIDAPTNEEFLNILSTLEDVLNTDLEESDLFELLNLMELLDRKAKILDLYDEVPEPMAIVSYLLSEKIFPLISLADSQDEELKSFFNYATKDAVARKIGEEIDVFNGYESADLAINSLDRLNQLIFGGYKDLESGSYQIMDANIAQMSIDLLNRFGEKDAELLISVGSKLRSDLSALTFMDHLLALSRDAKFYSSKETIEYFKVLQTFDSSWSRSPHVSSKVRNQLEANSAKFVSNYIKFLDKENTREIIEILTGLETNTQIELAYLFMESVPVPASTDSSYAYVAILTAMYEQVSNVDSGYQVLEELNEFTGDLPVYLFTSGILDGYYELNIEGQSYGMSILKTSSSGVAATISSNYEVYSFHKISYSFQEKSFIFNSLSSAVEARGWALKFTISEQGKIAGTLINRGDIRYFEGYLNGKYRGFNEWGSDSQNELTGTFVNTLDDSSFREAKLQLNGISSGIGASLVLYTGEVSRVSIYFDSVAWSKKDRVLYLSSSSDKKGAVVQLRGAVSGDTYTGDYIVAGQKNVITLNLIRVRS